MVAELWVVLALMVGVCSGNLHHFLPEDVDQAWIDEPEHVFTVGADANQEPVDVRRLTQLVLERTPL
jgi:hypothetical protein